MSTENSLMTPKQIVALIRETKPSQLVELDVVRDRCINMYNTVNGSNKGANNFELTAFHFKKMVAEKPDLQQASPISLYGCLLDIQAHDLSLDQGSRPDCYITTRNCKVGTDGQGRDIWEKRAVLSISPYGELKMRLRSGQIKYADNPVIVYEGDYFKVRTTNAGKSIEHEQIIPRTSKHIIASFIRLTRADGSFDFFIMDEQDIQRLAGYSKKNNGNGGANKLYSSGLDDQIDTGFLAAKTIKHAFKSYPRVPISPNMQIDPADSPATNNPLDIDYGVPVEELGGGNTEDIEHTDVENDASFVTPTDNGASHQMTEDDDDTPNFANQQQPDQAKADDSIPSFD